VELIVELFAAYGLALVFAAAFLDQGGIPVPAYPVIVVGAALAHSAGEPVVPILVAATLATLAADLLWFAGGRRIGSRLLRLMCRLSLSPDSCVAQTRDIYGRWGPPSLVVAKFIPGFAAVATTLAGESRTALWRFVLFDGLGAALWAGGAVLLGVLFHDAVNEVLATLDSLGRIGLPLILAALGAYVASKWFRRYRFRRMVEMDRIAVDDLRRRLDEDVRPLLIDVRSEKQRLRDGWIPGSVRIDVHRVDAPLPGDIVVYCDCPNDASAALAAIALRERGFRLARPLSGGWSAWVAAGLTIERAEPAGEARNG
jgi:membrane protein DedA with SNARE-associated domain/rhodanese-related sulfurtransferase